MLLHKGTNHLLFHVARGSLKARLLAPVAAEFYSNSGIADVMRVQCLNFALIPFGAVTMAYFRRQLNFRPIFIASLLSNVTTFTVATLCALRGLAYMSLAWSSLAGVVVTVVVAMWFRPRDFPRWPGLAGPWAVERSCSAPFPQAVGGSSGGSCPPPTT